MAKVKLGKEIKDVIRGDTRIVNCFFRESDKTTPINLAGGTVYFTVNSASDPSSDGSAALQKTTTGPFTDAANGKHTFTLTPSDTNIAAGNYWYDAQFVDALGNKLSSYRGKFIVQSDTTRT